MGRKKKENKIEKTDEDPIIVNALKSIEKEYGKGVIINIDDNYKLDIDSIPTGSISLDCALGVGGIPRGRVIELYGNASAGKTTLALSIIKQAQLLELHTAYIDVEHAMDLNYAKKFGINIKKWIFSQPDYGEQCLDVIHTLIETGKFGVIIVDSVAALTPKAEHEGTMTDQQIGLQARMLSKFLRKTVAILEKTKTSLIFINQIRDKIGVFGFGEKTTTPGGRALKFFSSVRIYLSRLGTIKHADKPIGTKVVGTIKKNKVAPPFLKGEFKIYFDEGISQIGEIIDYAIKLKIIEKAGGWLQYKEENIAHGIEKLRQLLRNDNKLYEEIKTQVMEALNKEEDNIEDEI